MVKEQFSMDSCCSGTWSRSFCASFCRKRLIFVLDPKLLAFFLGETVVHCDEEDLMRFSESFRESFIIIFSSHGPAPNKACIRTCDPTRHCRPTRKNDLCVVCVFFVFCRVVWSVLCTSVEIEASPGVNDSELSAHASHVVIAHYLMGLFSETKSAHNLHRSGGIRWCLADPF